MLCCKEIRGRLTCESENDKIEQCNWPGGSDSIIGEHICQCRDLAGQGQITPEELAEKWSERASSNPVPEWVENDL